MKNQPKCKISKVKLNGKTMSKKSISISILILLSLYGLTFAQETRNEKKFYAEKIYLVYLSEIVSENSEIIELRNFKGETPSNCKTEPDTIEAKVCDALKQFAKEQNIKTLINGDEIRRWEEKMSPYVCFGDGSDKIDVTDDFIKFYNTHFAIKKER